MKMTNKDFIITRVITKDIIRDSFNGLRNIFGLRLRNFEFSIQKHTNEMLHEMRLKYKVVWYRLSINPLVNGSVMINVYGEFEDDNKNN